MGLNLSVALVGDIVKALEAVIKEEQEWSEEPTQIEIDTQNLLDRLEIEIEKDLTDAN